VTSSSEEIKPVALSIVELCLAKGISLLANLEIFKTCWEGFRVSLKIFLGLV